jgi:hypothetical protein
MQLLRVWGGSPREDTVPPAASSPVLVTIVLLLALGHAAHLLTDKPQQLCPACDHLLPLPGQASMFVCLNYVAMTVTRAMSCT